MICVGLPGCLPRWTELCSPNKATSLVSVMVMATLHFGRLYNTFEAIKYIFLSYLQIILLTCRLHRLQCPSSQCRLMGRTRPTLFSRSLRAHSRLQQWSIFRAMRCRWFIFQQQCDIDYFLEILNIAIVAIIFLDHREWFFFDYFAHFEDWLFCDYSRFARSGRIEKNSSLNSVVNST